ncbi:MAG TPA: sulfur carrier protein ThiS [Candidatus Aminicenantes bacterium]|nr:sulfur carrier protein ThiS [Candidatus Aminicenantes bacterium]
MIITLNNRETNIPEQEEMTVKQLLDHMRYVFPNIVVKVNGTLVRKAQYKEVVVRNGDTVEAIHMISGG